MLRLTSARLFALFAFPVLLLAPGSAAAQGGGDVALGLYDCSFNSFSSFTPTPGLNLTITGPGTYTDADGNPGRYTFDAGTRILTMISGSVTGERLSYGTGPNLNYLTEDGLNFLSQCDLIHPGAPSA